MTLANATDTLVCVNPGELKIELRPAPDVPKGQVLVKPRRVGICGTDYHIYEGKHPFLEYPRVMGHELAVEVLEAPEGSAFSAGDICVVNPYLNCGECVACRQGKPNCCTTLSVLGVHMDGGMTGLLALPEANLIRAEGISTDGAATVEFLAIGAHAVRRSGAKPGDRALVIGAGPIGLGAALFARISGADVTMLDVDTGRLAAAEDIVGVGTITAGPDAMDKALALTDGDGFDLVFDATGNAKSMEAGFDYVAHGGRFVLVGVLKASITFADADFHRKEMTLMASRNATSEDFERVMGAIRDGQVDIDKLITHRTTLEGAVTDLPRWATEKTGLIKALIAID
ncbi:zinc-binding alcohol dehydrogenase family protein [Devosia sp.]|uniref:zinc-binding alcohol dehydrogenase family protein n=1 Tax=Devosia sp. TaxID=1871048 RepID=UPI003A8CE543